MPTPTPLPTIRVRPRARAPEAHTERLDVDNPRGVGPRRERPPSDQLWAFGAEYVFYTLESPPSWLSSTWTVRATGATPEAFRFRADRLGDDASDVAEPHATQPMLRPRVACHRPQHEPRPRP